MRMYSIPDRVSGFIFDMDNTLYTNAAYYQHTDEVLHGELAKALGVSACEACKLVADYQACCALVNDGKKPSLSSAFKHFGVSIAQSITWRNILLQPEKFLEPDYLLSSCLKKLAAITKIAVVTNNPIEIAERTLETLEIRQYVSALAGLDSFGVSKPAPEAFVHVLQKLKLPAQQVVAVGDRYEIDVEPVLLLGGGGVHVQGAEDVYGFPELFASRFS